MITRSSVSRLAAGLAAAVFTAACATSPTGPAEDLKVTAISPATGPTTGNTTVEISGTGFQAGVTVALGGFSARLVDVQKTRITATTPQHLSGAVDVVVANPGGQRTTLNAGFMYFDQPATPPPTIPGLLRIAYVAPSSGPVGGGTLLRIEGEGFLPGVAVALDDTPVPVDVISSRTLDLTLPAHPAGTVGIVVTNPDGTRVSRPAAYTYVVVAAGPAPSIAAIAPRRGIEPGGTFVTLTGSGFNVASIVTIDGVRVRASVFDPKIHLVMPPHPPGVVEIAVTNQDGSRARESFTYIALESLDLNGTWTGCAGDHCSVSLQFTIRDNVVTELSCGGVPHTFISPPAIVRGEVSVVEAGLTMTGRFLSDSYGVGSIKVGSCALPGGFSSTWEMEKQ